MTNSIRCKFYKLHALICLVDPDVFNDDRAWVFEKTSNRKVTKNDLILANELWKKYNRKVTKQDLIKANELWKKYK